MRLIIATNPAIGSVDAKNALTTFLEGKGWSVWHWFTDLWLIDGVPAETDLPALRGEILRVMPMLVQILIMSAEGQINHAGMVPAGSPQWFMEHWLRR